MDYPYPPSAAIDHAWGEVVREARSRGIRIQDVQLPPLTDGELVLDVWFFYEYEADVEAYEQDRTNEWVEEKFVKELDAAKKQFGFSELPETRCMFDSTENVKKNYQGSYYLRFK